MKKLFDIKMKQRNEDEFVAMIGSNERIIYKVCLLYTTEEWTLEDLYQETVYNLWRSFPRFRGESSYSTWIYRVALNTCITKLRKVKKGPAKSGLTGLENLQAVTEERGDNIRELYSLIQQLADIERAIVLLWLEEKSYQEISEITGLTISNVAVKLNRAKEKMRQLSKKQSNGNR